YKGKNGAEDVENFYKSAKEQGFKFAFRSYKPVYFEGFPPELYKYTYKEDILMFAPVVRCGGKIAIQLDKDENIIYLYDQLTDTKHGIIGFMRELINE
ncbi:MAG TPA: hypothetical protein V6C58_26720, partial [Allocoleopsis sp.]